MTNTIFYNLDNASYSTSSPDSTLSQQHQQQSLEPEGSRANAEASASSSYSTTSVAAAATADAINAWISRLNLEEVSTNGNEHDILSNNVVQYSILKNFSFKELKNATRNFHPDCLLGEGGFGQVFKGWIDENTLTATKPGTGTAVAVKRLNRKGFKDHRLHKEWLAEIKYLGKLYHLNLVRLLGHCLDKEERLLVYEFMPRGSLDNHLFRRASNCQLSWSLRLKIALQTAKALAFLHSAEINVIHRGLQSSNILLDSNYNAKLSDFGLARNVPAGDTTHVSTMVMGTYGYAAPEYICTGHLTAKNDVYGFGVVLLEILSGRKAIDMNRPSKEQSLVEWAKPYLSNERKIFHVLDSRLKGQYPLENAQKVANLALQCISMKATLRPDMDVVVTTLEQLVDSIKNPFL